MLDFLVDELSQSKLPHTIFLDFDGTLTQSCHQKTAPACEDAKRIVESLSKRHRVILNSSRSPEFLRSVFPFDNLVFIGYYGAMIETGNLKIYSSGFTPDLYELAAKYLHEQLLMHFAETNELELEYRKYLISIHLSSLVSAETVKEKVLPFVSPKFFEIQLGKSVIDIKPKTSKASVIHHYLEICPSKGYLICCGDDYDDEAAFKAIKSYGKRGVTIYVGKETEKTRAEYSVETPSELLDFLARL